MKRKLEVPRPLVRLGKEFRAAGHELYLVGGFVRDSLSARKDAQPDVDATTDARPEEFKPLLSRRARGLWDVGERFGTIGAFVGEFAVEVTTYRSDLYTAGSRHPEVTFGETLEDDLARRDFTINAVAADAVTGEVHDPFEGLKDLESGVIRAVGDPLLRMRDDPLRMLRAVRFETTLSTREKPFAMTADLEDAIRENADWLSSISAERIREEFEKILLSENVSRGVRTLVRLGLMPYVVPEFMETVSVEQDAEFHHKDVFEHTLLVVESVEADPVLRKAAFFHDIGKPRTLGFEHRCTYCGAKSVQKTSDEGECPECGGRTLPKKVHFYGHENVGAHIARRAMKRLAYPKDETEAVVHLVSNHMRPMSYAMARDPWSDSAVRRFVRDTYLARGERVLVTVDDLMKLARADITGSAPRRRNVAVESWRSLKERVDEVRAQDAVEKLASPLDGNELMRGFDRPPGPWIRAVKDYLEGEVVEGRLAKDDKETAWSLARAFVEKNEATGDGRP
ncbi:HD domain-containing protein [Rubrobacter radiotolerans]|uniref:HD domain-containing protein n=1 Tax=Rubrobacter radiotolerans TaxID=42256 RepID=A0AB35T640_RUBRA|nr:HDIG domain-containing metalloprotein [Rubrobacter radiotolerans]MDX5895131.1 HD domain-containing protein [Rubrobacter radiotolerans]